MALISLKCPHCNGDIQLDDSKEFGFCLYCGCKVMVDSAKDATFNRNDEIRGILTLSKEALSRSDIDKASELIEKAISINADVSDIWFLRAALNKNNNDLRNEYLERARRCTISLDVFSEEDLDSTELHKISFKYLSGAVIIPATIKIGDTARTIDIGESAVFDLAAGTYNVNVYFEALGTRMYSCSVSIAVDGKQRYKIVNTSSGIFTRKTETSISRLD